MVATDTQKKCFGACVILVALGVLITVITVPLSFHYVPYNNIAFVRDRYGATDTSHIIFPGPKFLTLNYDLVSFPSTYQSVEFFNDRNTGIIINSQTGLLFVIDVAFYYRLTPEKLAHLYRNYPSGYNNKIQTIAKSAIKDQAGKFSPEEYVYNKTYIEKVFAENVKLVVENQIDVDIPIELFYLQDIQFPSTILTSSLNSVLQIQNNILQQNKQQVAVVVAETNTMISSLVAEKNYILAYSEIQANEIVLNSQSYASKRAIQASNIGIINVAKILGIMNDTKSLEQFIKIMALYENSDPVVLFGNVGTILIK